MKEKQISARRGLAMGVEGGSRLWIGATQSSKRERDSDRQTPRSPTKSRASLVRYGVRYCREGVKVLLLPT